MKRIKQLFCRHNWFKYKTSNYIICEHCDKAIVFKETHY